MQFQKKNGDPTRDAQGMLPFHIFLISYLLIGLGLLIIYSSSSIPAFQRYGDAFFFLRKQFMVAVLGTAILVAVIKMPFRLIERLTVPSILIALGMVAATLIPGIGHKVNGASRWINLAGTSFQPAELSKLALILFLAKNLSRSKSDLASVKKGLIPNAVILACFTFLLMKQPDFGSTFVLCTITFLMLFTGGLPWKFITACLATGLAGIVAAVIAAPYRMARLMSFMDPWADVQRGGFQIIQSYLGFQNGGLLGRGLGESKQKLYFLPEAHTDFILSVIGEELGLIGVLTVIACFCALVYCGFLTMRLQQLTYRKFLAFGLTTLIAIQAAINMGVAMGVLPTKGMPLPFVSNGASSLLVFLIAVALLIKLAQEAQYGTPDSRVS